MATDKTRIVSARVPVPLAEALEADAEEIGAKPGALIRGMLEKRYGVSNDARKPCDSHENAPRNVLRTEGERPPLKDIDDDE